ncbi:class I SAM-dependent rRNA methyltransferase [Pelomonas aquatica]|jgi:23S rRNA (cytosine1962-C5)-methyltransferase|uniref:23S rRNA (Cytosine(1962)-C(5))-methyltransferase RlmI n=1 Tax=Pelomonas aquatica TaxID=431058 RepID=A0A9X4LPJ3_9BURK|nr:class I SAM-dependent methyltransferase [Pelomonas aquatica]MCY4756038.1 class I SAM-dependent methyltransferase [Pelomonas aquatica]MDG0864098.1 23S rRNA (cytosine(1962)-C(5))-methyltransferase RlmI [Pelomonas aquatica]
MKKVTIRPGKERSLVKRHPWVFESSIARGGGDSGETVRVESADGQFLCWAAFSPGSLIRLRAWSFDEAERIDAAFFRRRIAQAIAMRARLAIASDAWRLVHGEADGLPGLVVDRYGDTLVAQFGSAGAERWKQVIADALLAATGLTRLYERSDAQAREWEGLPVQTGWLRGDGETALTLREHDWRLTLDVAEGHKTGYYLDQRDSRKRFADAVRQFGCETVLNCFSYTGGFSVAALAGGARQVVSVDSSGPALQRAQAHVELNGFDAGRHEAWDADVNATLRRCLQEGRRFDAIVLDPPKFAPTAAHAERAARAYKDINRLAFMLLNDGGLLYTFSCSGGIPPDLFHKIVAGAGLDAGVDGYIVERLSAAADHPQTVRFPEGDYLKGLGILRR